MEEKKWEEKEIKKKKGKEKFSLKMKKIKF